MKKTVLLFGLASGALAAGMMLLGMRLAMAHGYRVAETVGFTSIVLSSLLVFFGVRSHREREGGLRFGRGFAVGAAICGTACAVYALTWGVTSLWLLPDLPAKLATCMVDQARADGKSDKEIAETMRQAEEMRRMEANPFLNVGEAFLEPLPFGLAAALIAAAVLRRRPAAG